MHKWMQATKMVNVEAEVENEAAGEKEAEGEWDDFFRAPSGNFGNQVIKMLLRIEDRADKVSNKITHIEERLMRLVYRQYEVIRICSQIIVEADPEKGKEWCKNHILTELQCFVEAQERQSKTVDDERKAVVVKAAMEAALVMITGEEDEAVKKNVQETIKDLKANGQKWLGFEVQEAVTGCQGTRRSERVEARMF